MIFFSQLKILNFFIFPIYVQTNCKKATQNTGFVNKFTEIIAKPLEILKIFKHMKRFTEQMKILKSLKFDTTDDLLQLVPDIEFLFISCICSIILKKASSNVGFVYIFTEILAEPLKNLNILNQILKSLRNHWKSLNPYIFTLQVIFSSQLLILNFFVFPSYV